MLHTLQHCGLIAKVDETGCRMIADVSGHGRPRVGSAFLMFFTRATDRFHNVVDVILVAFRAL